MLLMSMMPLVNFVFVLVLDMNISLAKSAQSQPIPCIVPSLSAAALRRQSSEVLVEQPCHEEEYK